MPEVQSDCLQTKVMTQLAFKGQCREAFELYERVLGGKIAVMNTFGGSDDRLPPGSTAAAPDQIRFAELQLGGYAILGNDVPVQAYKPAQGFNIALHVKTAGEARRIFNALSDDVTHVSDAQTTEDHSEWGAPPPDKVIAHTNLYWSHQTAHGRTAATVETRDVDWGDAP